MLCYGSNQNIMSHSYHSLFQNSPARGVLASVARTRERLRVAVVVDVDMRAWKCVASAHDLTPFAVSMACVPRSCVS